MALSGTEPAMIAPRSFGRAGIAAPAGRRAMIAPVAPAPAPIRKTGLRDWPHPLAQRWDRWCRRIEAQIEGRALALDLRHRPGSRAWLGGVARLALLACPALLCWPSFEPFVAEPLPVPGEAQAAELRGLAIRPLIAGAASGRHFAATDRVHRIDAVPERATINLTAVVGEHDDIGRLMPRLGLGPADSAAVRGIVAKLAPGGMLQPGTRLALTLGPRAMAGEARPLESLTFRPKLDTEATIARQGGALHLATRAIPIDATPLHLVGTVGSSLYRAARAAGASPDTVQAYLQAVDQYLPFEAIAPGDRFELVVAHRRAIDGSGDPAGEDGALLYAGVIRDGRPLLQTMRWGSDGNFYTPEALAEAATASNALMAAPVAGNITSWFGMRRHPILGFVRMHSGVDFAATYGAPIYAASEGVVSYAGWHGGHGNYVRLEHGGGIDTGYGHMSRIAVSPGMHVSRGAVIGYVGSTGLSTGPHLHYELFRGGQPVDPLSIRLIPHHATVSPAELAAFKAKMQQLLAVQPRA